MRSKKQNIIYTIILSIGIMVFFLSETQAQKNTLLDTTVSFKARNISLHEGLKRISNIINLEFSYNADLIDSEKEIKVNYDQITVRELLNNLLNDSTLGFQVADKQIIIRKKNTFYTLESFSNSNDSIGNYQIYGVVYDSRTGYPLSFANVAIKGQSIGSVTNEQGQFNLKISHKNVFDTLVISYIGYKNTYIPIQQLSLYSNRIYMDEDLFQIQEVVIRIEDPKAILREAIHKIKDNYFTDPYYITSFYREIVTNRDELASISEAVIKVYKSPYSGMFSDQVSLIKSRKKEYYTTEDTLSVKLKGGLYASLYLDAIKNPANFMREEMFHHYNYKITDIVKFDDNTAYVISFNPIHYLEDRTFEGKLFINTENLSIVAIEFELNEEAIRMFGNNLVVKKKIGTKVIPVSAKYLINYRNINGKYFMNLVRGELDFKVKQRRKLFSSDYKTVFEFASNNIDTVDVHRFERVETISTTNVFIDEDFQYDYQFWGKYNYISPDETIEEALIRIQKKLQELEDNE